MGNYGFISSLVLLPTSMSQILSLHPLEGEIIINLLSRQTDQIATGFWNWGIAIFTNDFPITVQPSFPLNFIFFPLVKVAKQLYKVTGNIPKLRSFFFGLRLLYKAKYEFLRWWRGFPVLWAYVFYLTGRIGVYLGWWNDLRPFQN